jgi:hypothetical protein
LTSTSSVFPAGSDGLVQQAVADLAARLQVSTSAIEIVSVSETEWRDSSLGLAEAGRMYAQVITPGLQIGLRAGGSLYRYHAGQNNVILAGAD